ncbi:hypothetical protein J2S98_003515 [Arthrobacter oryzae]|nr:hypothetical protein [Arthrobacter oryzae]
MVNARNRASAIRTAVLVNTSPAVATFGFTVGFWFTIVPRLFSLKLPAGSSKEGVPAERKFNVTCC